MSLSKKEIQHIDKSIKSLYKEEFDNYTVDTVHIGKDERLTNTLKNESTEDLIRKIEEIIGSNSNVDPLSGEEIYQIGSISMDREDTEKLIEHIKDQVVYANDKIQSIKSTIQKRQEVFPTYVYFDKSAKPLIAQGLMKVFKSSDSFITFEQYQAALTARKQILENNKNKIIPNDN